MDVQSHVDRLMLARLRGAHARLLGRRFERPGYAGLLDEVNHAMATLAPDELRQFVMASLAALFPGRALLAKAARRFPAEAAALLAAATPASFRWLVGPARRTGATTVEIPTCRFLAEGGVEACVRVCKEPTEAFFAEELRLPIHMDPDHRSGSCRVRYGAGARAGGASSRP